MLQHNNRIRHQLGNDYVTDLEEVEVELNNTRTLRPAQRKQKRSHTWKRTGRTTAGLLQDRSHG